MKSWIVLLVSLLLLGANASATESAPTFHFDNDLFSGSSRDQDYSWGAAMTFHRSEHTAWQAGLLAMTPQDLQTATALERERPYASLVYLTRAHMTFGDDGRSARYTAVTLGALGLNLANAAQTALHETIGGDVPRGWQHQIADGGEITARVLHARQWLLHESDGLLGPSQWKLTTSGSAGYLTEASAALSWRAGALGSTWWSHAPELADYIAAPLPQAALDTREEWFVFAGARVRARAYNALLQGQFRDSDVTIANDEVARVLLEGWLGASRNWRTLRVQYALRVSSPEVEHGPAARTLMWASVVVEKAFR